VPPLAAWLSRDSKAQPDSKAVPAKKANALETAEVAVDEFKPEKDGGDSPLDNMKNQADKLATAEKDALDQRQNSWGACLKTIVGSLVSSATGAFTGGIGARAGEEAVNAVFGKTK
jgi:hypothetical protein